MQTTLVRPGPAVPPRGRGLNGRWAVLMLILIVTLVMVAAVGFAFGQPWRQSERLVAPGLRHPRGITLARPDLLAVAEAGPPGRLSWVSTGESSRGTMIEGLPSEAVVPGQSTGPSAVALGADGRLWALTGGCRAPLCAALLARADDGFPLVVVDLRALTGDQADPWDLAADAAGTLHVTDPGAGAIVRIDPRTAPAAAAVVARPGVAADPRGIVPAPDGAHYVALRGAGEVARLEAGGALTTLVGGLDRPVDVGVEPDGRLLVLEQGAAGQGRLLRVDPARPTERQVLSSGLEVPTSLVVAADGRAYVAIDRGPAIGEVIQIRRLGPQTARRRI